MRVYIHSLFLIYRILLLYPGNACTVMLGRTNRFSTNNLKILIKIHFFDHKLKCLYMALKSPNDFGTSRQGQPVGISYKILSKVFLCVDLLYTISLSIIMHSLTSEHR
jgi:hypothetical protein